MNELPKIIEKLRQNGYFIYDFMYPEFDNKDIFIEEHIFANHERLHSHRSLARVLEKHLEQGIHIKPTLVYLALQSYKMKLPEQRDEKNSNRCDYPIEINLEAKTAKPSGNNTRIKDFTTMYEDVAEIFREFNWEFKEKLE